MSILLEQALFSRPEQGPAQLVARSAGFVDAWLPEAEALLVGFGMRPSAAFRCPPLSLFAKPLTKKHIAIVRLRDVPGEGLPAGLQFHFLVIARSDYEAWVRDPFLLAARAEPTWDGAELPTLSLATESFRPRTVAEVQAVLKRIKAAALREGEDPEAPDFERTIENSESPMLLGGAQILVDGGRLLFERPQGDVAMVAALWLLLPEATRLRLWPTTFAFSPELEFDVLVVPRITDAIEGYTSEEQAADYPQGTYELALQHAAEAGDQKELDIVFNRRDSWQTIKLGLVLLAVLSLIVLASRLLETPSNPLPVQTQKTAAAAGIVAVGDPWTAVGMIMHGDQLWPRHSRQ